MVMCSILTFKFLINLRILSFSKKTEFNLESVLNDIVEGKTFLLIKVEHWAAKKSSKRFAFYVKSHTILLFTNNGGINGTLVPL